MQASASDRSMPARRTPNSSNTAPNLQTAAKWAPRAACHGWRWYTKTQHAVGYVGVRVPNHLAWNNNRNIPKRLALFHI